jgi:hypothetical protein
VFKGVEYDRWAPSVGGGGATPETIRPFQGYRRVKRGGPGLNFRESMVTPCYMPVTPAITPYVECLLKTQHCFSAWVFNTQVLGFSRTSCICLPLPQLPSDKSGRGWPPVRQSWPVGYSCGRGRGAELDYLLTIQFVLEFDS